MICVKTLDEFTLTIRNQLSLFYTHHHTATRSYTYYHFQAVTAKPNQPQNLLYMQCNVLLETNAKKYDCCKTKQKISSFDSNLC